jgi:hypothetical protein
VQAALRGMAGRQLGAPTLPLPGHVHAAGVGGGSSAGHHLLVAHGRLCRGVWVKPGGCRKGAPASGYGLCVVQVRVVASLAAPSHTGCI